jgi:hypothetical protein
MACWPDVRRPDLIHREIIEEVGDLDAPSGLEWIDEQSAPSNDLRGRLQAHDPRRESHDGALSGMHLMKGAAFVEVTGEERQRHGVAIVLDSEQMFEVARLVCAKGQPRGFEPTHSKT